MEILKKDYNIKSPSPSNLLVDMVDDEYTIIYNSGRTYVDFSNVDLIKDLLVEIKNNVLYEKL
jgi:hypothetical protein